MRYHFDISQFYLPCDSVREVMFIVYILTEGEEDCNCEGLAKSLIEASLKAGFGADNALGWRWRVNGNVLTIYRREMLLDVHQHLEMN